MKKFVALLFSVFFFGGIQGQNAIALLIYGGGGDWYANPSSLPNLVQFCNQNLHTSLKTDIPTVEVGSMELYLYPMVHLTGHGNIILSEVDAQNLRNYLLAGGFLHADDNYGLKEYFFKAMKSVFPELEWQKLPVSHPIYHQKYDFPKGLPKIHAHDGKPAEGWGLIHKGRLISYFSVESDLGDGWENLEVHGDSPEAHLEALKMGANIVQFVFTQ